MHHTASEAGTTVPFSVILPTYNRAHLVGRAIRSVLNQTYHDFELIVVDDASTDETPEVVTTFSDPRLVYLRQAHNGGVSAARNMGIRRARGRFITFLDDDDEFLAPCLESIYASFREMPENVGFMWTAIRVVEDTPDEEIWIEDKIPTVLVFRSREEAYLSFMHLLPFGSGWGFTVRAGCFEQVGLFDETIRSAVDREFIIRLTSSYDFEMLPQILVKVHRHSGPKLRVPTQARAQGFERIIERNQAVLRRHPLHWAEIHRKTAALHYHVGNKRRVRYYIFKALSRCPIHLLTWKSLLSFELGHEFRRQKARQ